MKERIEVINDSFVDFMGETHHFTIAAVSKLLPRNTNELYDCDDEESNEVEYTVHMFECWCLEKYIDTLTKTLHLGIAICNPTDTFDPEIGKKKAIARAKTSRPVLYAVNPGTINSTMVQALLKQEAEYLKDNPAQFIKGYAEKKARWENDIAMAKMSETFTDDETTVLNILQKNKPNCLDRVFHFFDWWKRSH